MIKEAYVEMLGKTGEYWLDRNSGEIYPYNKLDRVLMDYLKDNSLKGIVKDEDLLPLEPKKISFKAEDVLFGAVEYLSENYGSGVYVNTYREIRNLSREDLKELQTALDNIALTFLTRAE